MELYLPPILFVEDLSGNARLNNRKGKRILIQICKGEVQILLYRKQKRARGGRLGEKYLTCYVEDIIGTNIEQVNGTPFYEDNQDSEKYSVWTIFTCPPSLPFCVGMNGGDNVTKKKRSLNTIKIFFMDTLQARVCKEVLQSLLDDKLPNHELLDLAADIFRLPYRSSDSSKSSNEDDNVRPKLPQPNKDQEGEELPMESEKINENQQLTVVDSNTPSTTCLASENLIPELLTKSRKKRHFLVYVNPVSGRRLAVHIWNTITKPMLEMANIKITCIITSRANQAFDEIASETHYPDLLQTFDTIVTIGGDGILSEVINGLHQRDSVTLHYLKSMSVAVIAGGTGNGLIASILHASREEYNNINATFVAIKGKARPTDLSYIDTIDRKRHLSFLMMSWGLIADVDIESETLRFLGSLRQSIYALMAIMKLKRYRGKFSYLVPGKKQKDNKMGNSRQIELPPLQESINSSDNNSSSSLTNDEEDQWVTIEDDFLLLLISHVSHIAYDVNSNPEKCLGDGCFEIMMIRKPIQRYRLLSLFLGIETGEHKGAEEIEFLKVKAYRLEPLGSEGIYSMDGEVITYGPIQSSICKESLQILSLAKVYDEENEATLNSNESEFGP